jgi:hypothetical protein
MLASLYADCSYIMFNIYNVTNPTSYWAIIVPLGLAVDMLHDSFTRKAHLSMSRIVARNTARQDLDDARKNGDAVNHAIGKFLDLLGSGVEHGRTEVAVPPGTEAMNPRMFTQRSSDMEAATMIMDFEIPGVSPGQGFWFTSGFSAEQEGSGTDKIVEVAAKDERVYYFKPKVRPPPMSEASGQTFLN